MNRKPVVLCPIDFSEASRGALRYAAAIAEHFESEVTVATVNDPLLSDADTLTAGEGHLAAETAQEMERFFRETFADRPKGIAHARFESATGTPPAEILGLAVRTHADVIVMSSHGATGVRKLFFGSTAERVLRETSVPVLVTPAGDAGPALLSDVRKTVRRVVAPVDLSEASARQVRLASGLAQALDVSLLLLHIVEPVRSARPGWRPRPNVDSERRDRAERQLESMVGTLPGRAKAEALVVFGEPSEEIAKVTHDRNAGLIVMGLHASPLLGPRMGSVTYRVLCLAHVLVLALPPVPVGTGTAGVRADRRDAGGIAGGAVA